VSDCSTFSFSLFVDRDLVDVAGPEVFLAVELKLTLTLVDSKGQKTESKSRKCIGD
jgi:hypothetical protein